MSASSGRCHCVLTLCLLLIIIPVFVWAPAAVAASLPGDVNADQAVNVVDVQIIINQALGIETGFKCDINGDGDVNASDVQLIINDALGITAQISVVGFEKALAASYVVHPHFLGEREDEFTILQLILISYSCTDFMSPKRQGAPIERAKESTTAPEVSLANAKRAAKHIIDSPDPVGAANRILGLGLSEEALAALRPHAHTQLDRGATLAGLWNEFFLPLLAKSMHRKKEVERFVEKEWPDEEAIETAYDDVLEFVTDFTPSVLEDEADEGIIEMFDRFLREAEEIAAETAWKMAQDMYESFEFGSTYVTQYVSTIPDNLKKTLYGFSLEDRVEAVEGVAAHLDATVALSEEVGAEFGRRMRQGAEDIALIEFESDWVDRGFRHSYCAHIWDGTPFEEMDFSSCGEMSYEVPMPQVKRGPNPCYAPGDGGSDGDGGAALHFNITVQVDLPHLYGLEGLYPCTLELYANGTLLQVVHCDWDTRWRLYYSSSDYPFESDTTFQVVCSSQAIWLVWFAAQSSDQTVQFSRTIYAASPSGRPYPLLSDFAFDFNTPAAPSPSR